MFFNSFTFFIFFIVIFTCYSLLNHKSQNRLLLAASYFFYGAWDYRFLALILITTVTDYTVSLFIQKATKRHHRIRLFSISIFINLAILGFFKYFNFFIDTALVLLDGIGLQVSPISLHIILPVGISFYTFQSMSYTIDVYRRKIEPITNILDYALYVSFFPQLVAGPIERATHLLPQILSPRLLSFEKTKLGFYYIGFGLFLKVFMADNLARMVDPVFTSHTTQTGFQYLLAGYAFAFQIYGDFAGYSYIAKGLGATLGFEIMDNFNIPYFAKNPQQFWARWHISLSTWLRDYLYIPLGGSKEGRLKTIRNLFLTMVLGGLWHGAKMTFIAWGVFHGLLLVMHHLFASKRVMFLSKGRERISFFRNFLKGLFFFHLIVISWYFFRSNSIEQVLIIFQSILTEFDYDFMENKIFIQKLIFYISPIVLFQTVQYHTNDQLIIFRMPILLRSFIYCLVFYLIVIFGVTNAQEFIYFQF